MPSAGLSIFSLMANANGLTLGEKIGSVAKSGIRREG